MRWVDVLLMGIVELLKLCLGIKATVLEQKYQQEVRVLHSYSSLRAILKGFCFIAQVRRALQSRSDQLAALTAAVALAEQRAKAVQEEKDNVSNLVRLRVLPDSIAWLTTQISSPMKEKSRET